MSGVNADLWKLMCSCCYSEVVCEIDDCVFYGSSSKFYYELCDIYLAPGSQRNWAAVSLKDLLDEMKPEYRPIAEALLLEYQMAKL